MIRTLKGARFVALALFLSLQCTLLHAQTPSTKQGWTKLNGNAVDIGISSTGIVHVVDKNRNAWRWLSKKRKWKKLPGKFTRVDTDINGTPWAVTTKGELRRYKNSHWQLIAKNIFDIGIGHTHIFVTHSNQTISRWDSQNNKLQPVPGHGRYIDVDHAGNPWVVTADSKVMFRKNNQWHATRITANDISVGKNSLYISQQGFELDPDGTRSVSIGPNDVPWLVTNNGSIYVQGLTSETPAEPIAPESSTSISSNIAWKKVPGRATDISISANGHVIAINKYNQIWLWKQIESTKGKWKGLPGKLAKVAIAPNGTIWGIDTKNTVRQYTKRSWLTDKTKAIDITAGYNNMMGIIQVDGVPAIWAKGAWKPLTGIQANRIAFDRRNTIHTLDKRGRLFSYINNEWKPIRSPAAIDLGIGPNNTIILVGQDKKLYRRLPGKDTWRALNGKFNAVALGPEDRPWGVTTNSRILASSFFDDTKTSDPEEAVATIQPEGRKGSAEPLPTSRETLTFQRVTGVARDVAIGEDGSVFAIDTEGQVLRYSNNKKRFLIFPGYFRHLAVSPEGLPWGIDSKNRVFKHDGKDWEEVKNITATDIAIAANGVVMVSDASEHLHQYNGNKFVRLRAADGKQDPRGFQITLDPKGNPWTIRKSGQVYRCDTNPCTRIEGRRAKAISAGSDGSVLIIDSRGVMQQYNSRTGKFDRLTTIPASLSSRATSLSVGQKGKPWLTTRENEIFASAFFERDESNDTSMALATTEVGTPSSAPTDTSTSTITFNKNIKFETIRVTARGVTLPIDDFAISPTGRILATDSGGNILEYSKSANAFNKIIHSDTPLQRLQMDANEVIWGLDSNDQVYRQLPNNRFQTVTGLTSNTATPQPVYLAVGADGSVFASSADSRLFEYSEQHKKFIPFKVQPNGLPRVHGIEPDGDPWVIDENTFQLFAFESNRFVKKRNNTIFFNIGAGGDLYIVESDLATTNYPNFPILRYNATNKSFDRTNATSLGLQVEPDGRLWVYQDGGIIQRAK